MFCPKCGCPLKEGTIKCEHCGCDVKSVISNSGNHTFGRENIRKIVIGVAILILAFVIINRVVDYISSKENHGNLKVSTSNSQNTDTVVSENNEDVDNNDVQDTEENNSESLKATSTPVPKGTPTPYPLSAIVSHVTDAEPSDLGEYRRPAFTYADATSYLIQQAHPEYDNSARSLIDGSYITSWQDGLSGDGTGQQITISLDEYKLIHYIEFQLGNWRTRDYYYKNNRPKQMVMNVDGTEFTLDFTDAMISHYVEFNHPVNARTLTFTINSVYKGTEANDCCIAEITAYTE